MRKTALFVSVVLLFGVATATAQMSPADAFNEGKSSGSSNHTQGMFNNVNNTKGEAVVTGYSQTPPSQSSYWGGGGTALNNLLVGGSGKVTECAGPGLNATNPADKQHCEAVDALSKQPSIRPTNLITNSDPLLLIGKTIAANPDAIAGAINSNYSNCTTTIKQNDPAFTMETCNDWSETGAAACTMGQEVVVDPDYLYRCSETLSVINTGQCTVGTVVTVDADSNYQCNRTVKVYQTNTCQKIAAVTVNTTTNQNVCTGVQAQTTGTTSYGTQNTHMQLSCTATPNVFSIYLWTTFNYFNCSGTYSAPADGVWRQNFCKCGYQNCSWNGGENRVTCSGNTCTWDVKYIARGGNYYYVLQSFTRTFTGTQSTSVSTASVTWTNYCSTLEARAQ